MSDKVKLKYTYTTTIEVERSSYSVDDVNEALDGKQGMNEHIIAIESDVDRAFELLSYELSKGEGDVKVEIVA